MFTPYKITYRTGANSLGLYLEDYVEAIRDIADAYSLPIIDLYSECGFNTLNIASEYTLDGLHANNAGYKRTNDVLISRLRSIGVVSMNGADD